MEEEYGANEVERAISIIERYFSPVMEDNAGNIGWALALLCDAGNRLIHSTDYFNEDE